MTSDDPTWTVDELLGLADSLISGEKDSDGVWPRVTVFLLRLGVEQSVDDLWTARFPRSGRQPMRSRMICLSGYVSPELARRAHLLWSELSAASHHHAYRLSPTASELRRWHGEAVRLHIALTRGEKAVAG